MWWLIFLGYYVFGLLLMSYMCPFCPMFEKMIGALIWPVSLAIGIVVMIREGKQSCRDEALRYEMAMLMVLLPILMKEAEAPKDDWTPDRN